MTGNAYDDVTEITLINNNLSRFESAVFQSLMVKMALFRGWPSAFINVKSSKYLIVTRYSNFHYFFFYYQLSCQTYTLYTGPIDCSNCHLAWLIRDNRNLLQASYKGTCSNGTTFENLNPNGFSNCPVIDFILHIIQFIHTIA